VQRRLVASVYGRKVHLSQRYINFMIKRSKEIIGLKARILDILVLKSSTSGANSKKTSTSMLERPKFPVGPRVGYFD
jgi:hypothetical protein